MVPACWGRENWNYLGRYRSLKLIEEGKIVPMALRL